MTESVWDYPRPPRLEACAKKIEVKFGGVVIAESTRTVRPLQPASAAACVRLKPAIRPSTTFRPQTFDGKTCHQEGAAASANSRVAPYTGTFAPAGDLRKTPPGATANPRRPTPPFAITWPSMPPESTNASSMDTKFSRNPAVSMAAGSRRISPDPLRGHLELWGGNRLLSPPFQGRAQ